MKVTLSLCMWIAGSVGPLTSWETVFEKNGVIVSSRPNPESSLPSLRGEGALNGTIPEVLAIFTTAQRHCEWMPNCLISDVVSKPGAWDWLLYHKIYAPWPVADRDVFLRAAIGWDMNKGEAWNRFWSVRHPRKVDGVVRMTKMRGVYHLIKVDEGLTYIIYRIDADPGGLIPSWMARIAIRDLPYLTILNLRRQLKRTRGTNAKQEREWLARFNTKPVQSELDWARQARQ